MIKYLTVEEILRLHFQLIHEYGGSHGVRDEGRLQSVVAAPSQTVFGDDQYHTVYDKAAVYVRNIIADHTFTDGNKRTGVTVAAIFMMRNHFRLTASPKELEDFAVQIAVDHLDIPTIAAWLRDHSAKI